MRGFCKCRTSMSFPVPSIHLIGGGFQTCLSFHQDPLGKWSILTSIWLFKWVNQPPNRSQQFAPENGHPWKTIVSFWGPAYFQGLLGGGNSNISLFSPRNLGKVSNLTFILFRWVGSTTKRECHFFMFFFPFPWHPFLVSRQNDSIDSPRLKPREESGWLFQDLRNPWEPLQNLDISQMRRIYGIST